MEATKARKSSELLLQCYLGNINHAQPKSGLPTAVDVSVRRGQGQGGGVLGGGGVGGADRRGGGGVDGKGKGGL